MFEDNVEKGIMPDLIDPNHKYVFRTGVYGIYDYWYIDTAGNYWRYTNAPEDHKDYDPYAGVPLLVRDQPMPSTAPGFFTEEGRKRNIAVPEGLTATRNPKYDPLNPKLIWYEVFTRGKDVRYVYLDSDVKENIDLWVQYQLRVTDSSLSKLRNFSVELFNSEHPKDKIIGAIIILVDQGLFELHELLNALVSDLEFIDRTVNLLGKKLICDDEFYNFLTSITLNRDSNSPLFEVDTVHGRNKFSIRHVYSIFHYMRISPYYLLSWHASHIYSKIFNRLSLDNTSVNEIENKAFAELKRVMTTNTDVQFLVDYKVKDVLLNNYKNTIDKSLDLYRASTDFYGSLMILSNLTGRKSDEMEFSTWLHSEPMHDISPEEEAAIEDALLDKQDAINEVMASESQQGGEVDTDKEVGEVDTNQEVGETDLEEKAGGE